MNNTLYVDCWTSGNPGIGGYRVVTAEKKIIVERNWDDKNSNNFYELAAIGAGIKALAGPGTIYSDSQTALSWVRNGKPSKDFLKTKDPVYIGYIQRIIDSIRALPNFKDVVLEKISGGANPADYGRRVH
jgi:ribonuclease HI